MSIVFVNNLVETFTPTQSGAIATWIWQVCQCAAKEGIEPLVISRECKAEPYAWRRTVFIEYPRWPKNWLGFRWICLRRRLGGWAHLTQRQYILRIAAAIREAGAERMPIVLQNDVESAIVLRECFPQAFIVHHFQNQQEASNRFRKRLGRSANVITAVSNFTARWVESFYELPAGSVQTMYNAVNTDDFSPAERSPGEDDAPLLINFVGRTVRVKAADLLLRAALRIAGHVKPFRIQVLGSNYWDRLEWDDYQDELKSLADQLSAAGVEVRLAGHVSRQNLPNEIRKAHIHVMPSRWDEPCALATLEGMACGLPTIASKTGGTPELVGDAGFLFQRESEEELGELLVKLLTDFELRREYGAKARARAEAFAWGRVWAEIRNLTNLSKPEPFFPELVRV